MIVQRAGGDLPYSCDGAYIAGELVLEDHVRAVELGPSWEAIRVEATHVDVVVSFRTVQGLDVNLGTGGARPG